jgi:hypothetical protein
MKLSELSTLVQVIDRQRGHVLSRCSEKQLPDRAALSATGASAVLQSCGSGTPGTPAAGHRIVSASAEYRGLHPQVQSKYNECMSTSTVGFAVADEDQERLARLVEHFGHGNRSAYLRATLPVMESLARAERLRELQARNAERAAAAGQDYESLLADIRRAYKSGSPDQ